MTRDTVSFAAGVIVRRFAAFANLSGFPARLGSLG
jgi:hypothetical protein